MRDVTESIAPISWGDPAIDLVLPRPATPSMLLIEQERKEFRGVLLRMVADELAAGRPVHWIDGGMGFDPSPLLPLLRMRGCHDRSALRRFHICRGFTAHQTASIVERLAREASSDNAPKRIAAGRLIIASDLPRMFMDAQLKAAEARSLLRATIEQCRRLSRSSSSLLLITSRRYSSPPLSRDMRLMLSQEVDDVLRLSGIGRGRRGYNSMRLHLASLDRGMVWARLPLGQTSLLEFRQTHASSVVCNFEPPATLSSLQPNGESRAVAARTASGV